MSKLLNVDGTVREVAPKYGAFFRLRDIAELVGETFELLDVGWLHDTGQLNPVKGISIGSGDMFIVNRDRSMEGAQLNPIVSALIGRPIVGPVLLCNESQLD
jgi:hypothetical protein